jgi:hypothetical protein
VRYLQAYLEGLRFALDPANKTETIELLAKGLNISPHIATRSYAVAVDPKNGFMRDAKLDLDGFKNVLKLRAELHGDWGGKPPAPEQYIDLSHYQRAIAGM